MTKSYFTVLLMALLGPVTAACVSDANGSADSGEPAAATTNPPDHQSTLAPVIDAEEAARRKLDDLPVVRDSNGKMITAPMPQTKARISSPGASFNPANRDMYVVGGEDLVTYYYLELPLPRYMTDVDGGTIRLIMQHENDPYDQVRVIDEHIATEYQDNTFGARGRYPGRSGWTRQSGGGEWRWVLGDGTRHNLASPWSWAVITDYRWMQDEDVLGGDTIRVYSHPQITTRVIFLD